MSGSYRNHNRGDASGRYLHSASTWGHVLFTAAVGFLLLLNGVGKFTTLFGFDTALFLAILAGYKIIYQAILDLLNRRWRVEAADSSQRIQPLIPYGESVTDLQ
jgi:hypothetical protein